MPKDATGIQIPNMGPCISPVFSGFVQLVSIVVLKAFPVQPPDYTFDKDRLAALADYAILDTPPEPGFDDIVQLASLICHTPVALVSLVAADRQWFKARVGFEPCETDLNSSVCAHALIVPDILVIPDLTQDPRTHRNPLVTSAPSIRFYAGAPFHSQSGEVLGSLCVIDGQPRPAGLTPAQAEGLRNLARQVTSQLSLRKAIVERDALLASQARSEKRRQGLLALGDSLSDLSSIAEVTQAAAGVVGETLGVSRAAFGRFDGHGEEIVVEPDWTAEGVSSLAGRYRVKDFGHLQEEVLRGRPLIVNDVRSDARTAEAATAFLENGVAALVRMPVREHGRTVAVFVVHDTQPREWRPEDVGFLRNAADRVEAGIARIHAEEQQKLLNAELGHRLKNTFAMVQAMAVQTFRGVTEQANITAFIQRIHALSAAQDELVEQNWTSAKLELIVPKALSSFCDADRFEISGPSVELGARSTLLVSLLLHELMTNALKHGALSAESGKVSVRWEISGFGEEAELRLEWAESGGPAAQPPTRRGFGSKLIAMGLVGTGGVDLRYLSSGFVAVFKAPLSQVQAS